VYADALKSCFESLSVVSRPTSWFWYPVGLGPMRCSTVDV
jgi:hypothetical protein